MKRKKWYKPKKKPCKGPCGKMVYYYKNQMCKSCHFRLHPPKLIKRSKPPRKVSTKRENEVNQYRHQKADFIKDHPCCSIGLPGCSGCDRRFLTIHHRKGRENDLLNNEEFWITACIFCHDRIHTTDTEWAYENGFLLKKHSNND